MGDDWTITVYGGRDPSPFVGYQQQELSAVVATGDQHARWVSLAGIARLDIVSNVAYWPKGPDLGGSGSNRVGRIQIITPLVLADGALISSAASIGLASYVIDDLRGDFGWAIYFTDVDVQRNHEEGCAEIIALSQYRGDWGLDRVGFKADLLIRQTDQG